MSHQACLGAASPISRDMYVTIPDDVPPDVIVVRYWLSSDLFTRVWQLRSTTGSTPRYRCVGDSSRTYPGAFDGRVEAMLPRARDFTHLVTSPYGADARADTAA